VANSIDNSGNRQLTVLTYNIYQGTELENSIAAKTGEEFVIGATKDFLMMRQTNFFERARAIAAEIAATRPDLIGLQEVALWRTGPHRTPAEPATNVDQDFLQILIDALGARGLHYSTVASVNNFDVQGPVLLSADGLTDVRLTDRDVILARTDEYGERLKLSNSQSRNYATNLVITTVGGPVTVLEGWASIDVKYQGREVRFITTHLDAFVPQIRLAQATELLNGPARTNLSVILAGDMNTTATTDTYAAIMAAGFVDAWAQLRPADAGFTCCEVLPTIGNAIPALYERVDLFLLRGDLEGESISRIGVDPSTRTAAGLWPSDHAGLVATIQLVKDE
jgi:endonuclease/exonuclease/phosphatase family metal-dependent hydrolase